jgi:hypothetical protein
VKNHVVNQATEIIHCSLSRAASNQHAGGPESLIDLYYLGSLGGAAVLGATDSVEPPLVLVSPRLIEPEDAPDERDGVPRSAPVGPVGAAVLGATDDGEPPLVLVSP